MVKLCDLNFKEYHGGIEYSCKVMQRTWDGLLSQGHELRSRNLDTVDNCM